MRFALRWLGVVLIATAIDLLVRFALPFDLSRVLRVEAALFPLTGLALFLLFRSEPRASPGWRRVQIVVIAAFPLAGIRSGLWAAGLPVQRANLVVLAIGIVTWLGFRLFGGRDDEGGESTEEP